MSLESVLSSAPGSVLIAVVSYLSLPRVLAVLPPRIQFVAKYIVYVIGAIGISAAGCVIAVVCTILGKRHWTNYIAARAFSYLVARPCGITLNVKNEERLFEHAPAIMVCNHQSTMDMVVIGRVYPPYCAIMAKKELLYIPFLNLYMKMSNVIFIDRKNHKQAVDSTSQAVIAMKKHRSGMWVFPEGTRSHFKKAGLLPFKKGAFHLAIQSQYPIIPIVCKPYSHIYDSKKQHFPGGEVEIRILEPIPTTGMTLDDLDGLIEQTRAVMLKHLNEMDQTPVKIQARMAWVRPRL